jgi:hypothetical protein
MNLERTKEDPEGWLPSWHLWAEDVKDGEEITIFQTVETIYTSFYVLNTLSTPQRNIFALFRNKYWLVTEFKDYGKGTHSPPKPKKRTKYRTLTFKDDDE